MNSHPPRQSASVWMDQGLIETAPLDRDVSTEVCIVGAGIAGLLTAVNLLAEGRQIVIVNDSAVGGGETCRTTAHLVNALDDRYTQLEKTHGAGGAFLAAQSHAAAIDHLEALSVRYNISCAFKRLDGYLCVNARHAGKSRELLADELRAARGAGVRGVEVVPNLPTGWPREFGAALKFPGQAQFDPMRFIAGITKHLLANGVRIHTGTRATDIKGGDDAYVKTASGATVSCSQIVVATNTPVNDRLAIHTKQAGYQTYVIAATVPDDLEPILLWDGLWEDDEQYHYVRTARDNGRNVLIVGGEDHKAGQNLEDVGQFARLEQWTRRHMPQAGSITARWSGIVMEPVDGLAYIGRNPLDSDNVYIVTGDSGNGMTHGAIAGMLITDLIMGRKNPWTKLYDPARKVGLSSAVDYARENLNTAAQYADWARKDEVESEAQIAPGTGAIISRGLQKIAIFKDSGGVSTRLSAACPHLGGVVRWNGQDKTWDCPCHSSRFDASGTVMHGPANADLTILPPEEEPSVKRD